MRVVIHSTKPKGQPAGVGFENGEPQLRKTLQNSCEDEMTERSHIVARKSQGMVQAAQRELYIFPSLAFELSKWMKAALSIFAVDRNGKIQLASEIPQCIILRLVQVFPYR